MPNAQLEHVAVDTAQDSPLVVALTDEQLSSVLEAVASSKSEYRAKDLDDLLAAVEGVGADDASALVGEEQYSQIMRVQTANSLCLVMVVVLLFVVIGVMLAQVFSSRLRG